MSRNFTHNRTAKEKRKVLCQSCDNVTQHIVLASINENGEAPMSHYPDDMFYWTVDYETIQCLGCENISFRSVSSNSEDDDEYGRPTLTILIYPKRSKDSWKLKSFMNVPFNLQRIHREAINCYNNDNLTLCAAGVRALVEGICKENGIDGGNVEYEKKDGTIETKFRKDLQGKINGLHEKGKLTEQNANILHEHRFLGNTAIHELSTPSKEDLGLALEIVESVFDTLYELPHKGLKLKRKRLSK